MFYPVESLKRGGKFYLCWVADSWPVRFATITHKQLCSQDIRKICDDLHVVMNNESGRQTKRFSLRLSSQLLRGLVRLYQRKVAVFVGELWKINATVIKITNKKWSREERATVVRTRPAVPAIVLEQEGEERIAERIQNSGNIVANIEDITLKESVIPERQLLDDGFGELGERTIEVMLGGEAGGGGGGTEAGSSVLAADVSSRRDTSRHLALQPMETALEHDTTLFSKSFGDVPLPVDSGKEIPEIPEILPPELPVPVTVNDEKNQKITEETNVTIEKPAEKQAAGETEELVLEELLEEPQVKRRRRNRLIIDKNIKFSAQYMMSRLTSVNVEQRCEDSSDDVMCLLVPATVLLTRPACAGWRVRSSLGSVPARLAHRHMTTAPRPHSRDADVEEALTARTRRSTIQPRLEIIEEEPPIKTAKRSTELQNITAGVPDISIMEFANLPTQKLVTSPPQKRSSDIDICVRHCSVTSSLQSLPVPISGPEDGNIRLSVSLPGQPKRIRHAGVASGVVSFRESQLFRDMLAIDANKENIPLPVNIPIEEVPVNIPMDENIPVEKSMVVDNTAVEDRARISAMLEGEGLTDDVRLEKEKEVTQGRNTRTSGTETPLGSLDRTKVSLGDSDVTTDSQMFLRREWGTHGTMHKIYRLCVEAEGARGRGRGSGRGPLGVAALVAAGPATPTRRLAAARCFASILNLKQHGFINVEKDPETKEILNISLGNKVLNK